MVAGSGYGIAEAAARGALAEGGQTIVVLACGIDHTYPVHHADLHQRVLDNGGLLVSEYPIGTVPTHPRRHVHSRLLAALSSTTVLVEAGQRSNTQTPIQVATTLGRPIYGVPGLIYSASSTGVNELLRTGTATAITSTAQLTQAP